MKRGFHLLPVPWVLLPALLLTVLPVFSAMPGLPGRIGTLGIPAATAAPPLSVTVSQISSPRYGDELTFSVRSTGIDVVATVSYAGTELATKPVEGGTTFAIATLGRFTPGTYRLDVEAASETSSGSTRVSFTTTQIPSHVELTRTAVDYTAPLTGRVIAERPTTVGADGRVELVSNGSAVASAPVRADGSFGLAAPMPPCECRYPVEVRLVGTQFWAATGPGAGSFVGTLQVDRLATRLEITFPGAEAGHVVTQGDPFMVEARVDRVDPATDLVLYGALTLSAVPVSGGLEQVVASQPAERGLPLEIDATEWLSAHEGAWTFTLTYAPSPVHAGLVAGASTSFDIVISPARPWPTSTALSLDRPTLVAGQTLTGAMETRDAADATVLGARLEVDDEPWPQTTIQGTRLSVAGLGVGTHRLRARFAPTPDYRESASGYVTVVVTAPPPRDPSHQGQQSPHSPGTTSPAASSIRVVRVVKRPHRKARITVAITGPRGAATNGTVVLRRVSADSRKAAGKVIARGRVRAGRVTVSTQRLARGLIRLRATFSGTPGLRASTSAVIRIRFR